MLARLCNNFVNIICFKKSSSFLLIDSSFKCSVLLLL